jgi:NAD-dependent deacetylase
VWRFYSERRVQAKQCAPNAAHRVLAELEATIGERLFLCTQNVDPLHERAGSRRVVHMHGELFKSRCDDPRCATSPVDDETAWLSADALPQCGCGALMRPHICWFGEVPYEMDRIARELSRADLFVVIGSSGAVYPAAGFVQAVRARGKGAVRTVYVGPERPDNAWAFDTCVLGKAGEVLPTLFQSGLP